MVSVLPAREQGKAFIVSIKYLLCVYMVSVHMCVQRPWPEVDSDLELRFGQ